MKAIVCAKYGATSDLQFVRRWCSCRRQSSVGVTNNQQGTGKKIRLL